jgi:hypothetical protein
MENGRYVVGRPQAAQLKMLYPQLRLTQSILFLLVLLFSRPTLSYSAVLGDAWSRMDRSLSIFDPAGD